MKPEADKDKLYTTDEIVPINRLSEILPSLQEAVTYVLKNFKTKDTFPLANLSINSKYFVFNSCHSFCDGVFLTRILNQIQNPIKPTFPFSQLQRPDRKSRRYTA